MSIFRRKKQTDAETESLKSFLDMIAPSIVKFETGSITEKRTVILFIA